MLIILIKCPFYTKNINVKLFVTLFRILLKLKNSMNQVSCFNYLTGTVELIASQQWEWTQLRRMMLPSLPDLPQTVAHHRLPLHCAPPRPVDIISIIRCTRQTVHVAVALALSIVTSVLAHGKHTFTILTMLQSA